MTNEVSSAERTSNSKTTEMPKQFSSEVSAHTKTYESKQRYTKKERKEGKKIDNRKDEDILLEERRKQGDKQHQNIKVVSDMIDKGSVGHRTGVCVNDKQEMKEPISQRKRDIRKDEHDDKLKSASSAGN